MATIHISEADAAGDFAGLMARVRAGVEVVIEKESSPAVVLRVAVEPRVDPEFAADLEEIIRNRRPRDTSAWD